MVAKSLDGDYSLPMPQQPLWEQWLKPFFQTFLIDEAEIKQVQAAVNWDDAAHRFSLPEGQAYPDYYESQAFHGIEGGYLIQTAALTYDPITRYVLPPNEDWVRQGLIEQIGGAPQTILDLGCGTGSQTLALKRAFPRASVTGLDLSPQMLAVAAYKAERSALTINWQAGLAEATKLGAQQFDVITAVLLFHETPPSITQAILREVWRLLKPGGQFLMLDGNQSSLRQQSWLTDIFEEPYMQAYAQGNLKAWLNEANFMAISITNHWWVHQVGSARKPLLVKEPQFTNLGQDCVPDLVMS